MCVCVCMCVCLYVCMFVCVCVRVYNDYLNTAGKSTEPLDSKITYTIRLNTSLITESDFGKSRLLLPHTHINAVYYSTVYSTVHNAYTIHNVCPMYTL